MQKCKEDDAEVQDEQNKEDGNEEAVIDPNNLKDGIYLIDFEVQESNSDQLSMMDQFAETPGHLKVKDGKKYIAMNFTSRTMITDFQTEKNGEFVSAKSLSFDYVENDDPNKAKDEGVVEFEVEDLSKRLHAKVAVEVPGMYSSTHDVGLSFNEDSIKQVSAGEYPQDKEADKEDPRSEERRVGRERRTRGRTYD